jgi:hypothetical protein
MVQKFQIWEYSTANMDTWARHAPRYPLRHVPIGYAPILTRIPRAPEQDIDILIYGSASEKRLKIFSELADIGIATVFATGMYGESRDRLIARSKIVLNINMYTQSRIFEVVRVSYLLANSKAVVADYYPDSVIEGDLPEAVNFVPHEQLIPACLALLENEELRLALENRAFATITKRDIRGFLALILRE